MWACVTRVPVWVQLYFGNRYRQREFLYGDELEQLHATADWFTLRTAFSRDDAKRRVYVQHVMPQDELLYRTLVTQRGHLYICGNRNLPTAVQVRVLISRVAVLSGWLLAVYERRQR